MTLFEEVLSVLDGFLYKETMDYDSKRIIDKFRAFVRSNKAPKQELIETYSRKNHLKELLHRLHRLDPAATLDIDIGRKTITLRIQESPNFDVIPQQEKDKIIQYLEILSTYVDDLEELSDLSIILANLKTRCAS